MLKEIYQNASHSARLHFKADLEAISKYNAWQAYLQTWQHKDLEDIRLGRHDIYEAAQRWLLPQNDLSDLPDITPASLGMVKL